MWWTGSKAYRGSSSWRFACLWSFGQPIVDPAGHAHLYPSCILYGAEQNTPIKVKVQNVMLDRKWVQRKSGVPSPPIYVNEHYKPCWWILDSHQSWRHSPSPTCSWCCEYRPSPWEDLWQLIWEIWPLCGPEWRERQRLRCAVFWCPVFNLDLSFTCVQFERGWCRTHLHGAGVLL